MHSHIPNYSVIPLNKVTKLQALNEQSVMLYFDYNELNKLQRNEWVVSYYHALLSNKPIWLNDMVPSYETLLIEFDSLLVDHYAVINYIRGINTDLITQELNQKKLNMPICFEQASDEHPLDSRQICQDLDISIEQLKHLFLNSSYRAYAVGFMPNFAYLGYVHEQLKLNRLKQPRAKVPAGAVAIADDQCAIYPKATPGGWQIIAYTPIDLASDEKFEMSVGDEISFYEIDKRQFFEYAKQ